MFDAVVYGSRVAKGGFLGGAIFSIATHVLVVGGVITYVATHRGGEKKKEAEVTFFAAQAMPPPPPPPPPPPGGGALTKPKIEQQKPIPVKKPDTFVDNKDKDKPEEKPKEEPKEAAKQEGGVEGGVDGGVVGGTVGGTVGGVIGGVIGGQLGGVLGNPLPPAPTYGVIPFGEGMNRPSLISGSMPSYTREALEAKVEGKMLVKCVITTEGSLTNCRIIKSLPYMDRAVLDALARQKYTPVTYQGHPQAIEYVIPFTFKLP